METVGIVEDLVRLVLNERQAKVYLALLRKNNSTAMEICKISGVLQSKIYGILEYLVVMGFCIKKASNSSTIYEAIDPGICLDYYIKEKKKQYDDMIILKEKLEKIYISSKENIYNLNEYIETIHGNKNVHKKFMELLNKTKHTVLSISCPPYTIRTQKEAVEQKEAAKAFFKRGGIDKSIREVNERTPEFIFASIRSTLENYNPEDNRITSKSPIKLFIFDNETLMTFNNAFLELEEDICTSIIKEPNTVNTYIHMFNFLFEQAETFDSWIAKNQELYIRKLADYDKSNK